MKKLSAFIFFFSAAAFSVSAQKKLSSKPVQEEWAENPKVHPVPPEYANEHAIMLFVDEKLDFRHEPGGLNVYRTFHRLVKVLDHQGIEQFNTISIPHWYAKRIPLIRARTILPNGQVKEIPKEMILTSQGAGGNYKVIIAMEGVEPNAEIELLLKEATPASYFENHYFQYNMPIMHSTFELNYPKDLSFELKSYNGYPAAKEAFSGNRKSIKVSVNDIPALRPEPYSFYNLNRMHAEYRISDFATDYDKTQELTWDSLAKALHHYNYDITQKEQKAVNDFLTEIGVRFTDDEFEKIKKIENGIKTNVVLYQAVDYNERKEIYATKEARSISVFDVAYYDKQDILDSIISKRSASGSGYLKLFAACFAQAGVNHEIGVAVDNKNYKLDPKFPNWNETDFPLFYFPNQKKFIAPLDIYYRCPFVSTEVVGGKGVFSRIPPYKRKGDLSGPLYEIKTIAPLPARQTQSNVTANVYFSKDMDAQLDIAYSYTGYRATDIRTNLAILRDEQLKDYIEDLISIADKKEDVIKYTISNEGFDKYYNNKPLEIYASVNTSRLVEKAGPKYLVKVGEIIGHQMELYSEEKRKMPVDIAYPYSSTHSIIVNIPKGYKVTNPEALRMSADYLDRNIESVASFSSDYKIEDDKLIVTVTEIHSKLHYSSDEYERFRQIINTAADFNKVKILLEKGKMPGKPKGRKKVTA